MRFDRLFLVLLLVVGVALGAVACKKSDTPTEPKAPDVLTWEVACKTEDLNTHAAVDGVLVFARSNDYYESTRATTNSDGMIPPQAMQSAAEPVSLYWVAQPRFGSNYVRFAGQLPATKQRDPITGKPLYFSLVGLSQQAALADPIERPRAVAGCRLFDLIVYGGKPPANLPSCDGTGGGAR